MKQADRATAYHEAGHAVATIYLGYDVVSVSIKAGEERSGRTTTNCPGNSRPFVIVALAGVNCTDAFRIPSPDIIGGAASDLCAWENALVELSSGSPGKEKRLSKRLRGRTKKIFQKPAVRSAVETLVPVLLAQTEMAGPDVHAIVEPILGLKRFRPRQKFLDRHSIPRASW